MSTLRRRVLRPLAGAVEADTGHHFVRRADNPKLARRLKLRDGFVAETAIRRDHPPLLPVKGQATSSGQAAT